MAEYDYATASGYPRLNSNWQDYPTTSTPVTAAKLNHIDQAVKDLKGVYQNVRDFQADATGATDTTADIQAAVDTGPTLVPPGTYRCDTPVVIGADKRLVLMEGATIKRVTAASSTDEIIRLNGNNARLLGPGIIQSEKTSPRGIVHVGPASLSTAGQINWARIQGPTIHGVKTAGNYGIYFDSAERSQGVNASNYNGLVADVVIRTIGTGIRFDEYCNAHMCRDVFFYDVATDCYYLYGKQPGGAAGGGVGEIGVVGGFTHASANVCMIRLEQALYPTFMGVHGEPGTGSTYYNIDSTTDRATIVGFGNTPSLGTNNSATSTLLVNGQLTMYNNSSTGHAAVLNGRAVAGGYALRIVDVNGFAGAEVYANGTNQGSWGGDSTGHGFTTRSGGKLYLHGGGATGEVKLGQTTDNIGFFGATPVAKPAANADTSGATLGQLETEVNELKQLLRNLGLMTP